MALKADRQVDAVDLSYYFNGTASKGQIVCVGSTQASGVGLDSAKQVAVIAASASGAIPIGMLLQDVVSIDLTRTPINWHKDQAASGDKVTIMTKGWAVTDQVTAPVQAGSGAILIAAGKMQSVNPWTYHATANAKITGPMVGTFRSGVDQNGFARVYIDL